MTTKQSGRHGLADSEIRSKMLPCTHRGRHSWQSNLKSQTRTNNNASLIDWVWSRFWIQQSWSLDSHLCTPDWNLDFTFNDTSENEWHWAHGKQSRKKRNVMKLCGPQAKIAEPFGKLSRYHNWSLLCMRQTEEKESGHLGNAKWYITECEIWANAPHRPQSPSPQSPLSPLMTTAWQMEDCNSTNWRCPWQP